MPYYTGGTFRGDYYRGDYYRGDPGLFSFLGKALGGVAKVAVGALGLGGGSGASYGPAPALPRGAMISNYPPPGAGLDGGGLDSVVVQRDIAGGLYQSRTTMFPTQPGMKGMKRCHPNKSTYVTRGGGTSHWPRQLQIHQKGTVCVTPRRMNVGNARALRRALRRVSGFAKLVKRSRRAVSRAASAVGIHRTHRPRRLPPAPSVRLLKP